MQKSWLPRMQMVRTAQPHITKVVLASVWLRAEPAAEIRKRRPPPIKRKPRPRTRKSRIRPTPARTQLNIAVSSLLVEAALRSGEIVVCECRSYISGWIARSHRFRITGHHYLVSMVRCSVETITLSPEPLPHCPTTIFTSYVADHPSACRVEMAARSDWIG